MIMTKSWKYVLVFLLMLMGVTIANDSDDWVSKCNKCRCHWKSSKKTADCRDTHQRTIPTDLHTDIQQLDLSNNKIAEIQKKQLSNFNLHNLHKLMMSNCTLVQVDVDAFFGLSILIELDLSYNQIGEIPAGIFHPLIKIRKILLNNNEIQKISDRTFENLQHLSHIELKDNKIKFIGEQAFLNVPLKVISLANNRLQRLEKTTFMSLTHLNSLSLGGNMWNCTCELKDFRNFVVAKKLTTETKCHYPDALRDRMWTEVGEEEFACMPRMTSQSSPQYLQTTGEIQTLKCHVKGTPRPNIDWFFNNRLMRSNDRYKIHIYEEKTEEQLLTAVSELTIINLSAIDRGNYVCRAKNLRGQADYSIQLEIFDDQGKDETFLQLSSENPSDYTNKDETLSALFFASPSEYPPSSSSQSPFCAVCKHVCKPEPYDDTESNDGDTPENKIILFA